MTEPAQNTATLDEIKDTISEVTGIPVEDIELPEVAAVKFDLNIHVARLLMKEPFFAALSRRIDKRASSALPTAGVRVNPDSAQFEMLYNPDFFAKLTDDEKTDVLKHEFYHIIFEHVTGDRFQSFADMPPADCRRHNIAMDLAINSHLSNLPEGCCKPGIEGPFAGLPSGKTAEWYLANLPENENEGEGEGEGEGDGDGQPGEGNGQGQPGEGNGSGSGGEQFDDHSMWGGDAEANDIAKERLKDVMKKASEEASRSGGWGTVPADVRKDILDRLSAKIDWRKVLRYFIKTSQRANKQSTVKRINRRYPYIHPGRKVKRQAKIAISIDQSGSVDDEMLALFFAELNQLADLAEFTVVPFDTRVAEDKVFVWKKGEKRPRERVAYGGTCFNAPTKFVNKGSFDGHIILTDLMAPKPVASKCQRMWMTTKYHADNPYFKTNERVIAIDDK